ncbi:myosin heavy chain 95F isoform X1 [Tribolium castaneum]|uniref:myosin heavy chain 95F isoform X1 n=1 Tax=Tribolium castaneum TaxID=7070 RepID=UPI00046C1E1E|nr:PREDICTED: myosin heavy chain 95F isoform X1 [Tribolium castaneum]XP_008201420.1 PREDICTED: myosin heavy chain 95F isoform X1 [Tribolium castaneum]|eukprot:XP_008201419.1 PREDICTED: myosin heavy chain 95F isoform X1 [Tribolium castaneum]
MDSVWARDPTEGFILARISELLVEGAEVIPVNSKFPKRVLPFSDIFKAQEDDVNKDYDDNCEMVFLNEGSLLNNIRIRYYQNKIYTYVANILIAVNPYKDIPQLYSPQTIKNYQGKSLGQMPPHVFAIADKAFRDMKTLKQSQSIIVSGESGAGKTESTKHLLKYLCVNWGAQAGPIEQKILDANPVLEAFGNAKTTRNNNSSRFGKFMEVHFDKNFHVAGGHISHYLLEKSRICSPQGDERSYHIFYMMMAGAPEGLRQKLALTKPDDFNYLKSGCTRYFTTAANEKKLTPGQKSADHSKNGPLKDILIDDIADFLTLDGALSRLGLSDSDRFDIYSTVAAVLHLGNIEFEENPEDTRGGCRVSPSKAKSLEIASGLLGIDPTELRQALEARVMQSSRGGAKGTVIMVPLKVYEANNARDALAKAIYSNLFDYIVNRINQSIPFQTSSYYIGVLDIAGFEFFTVNSFEQFCINYCNEKLQQFFNEVILKNEQELYKREGLSVPEVNFVDNQDCINLIETKSNGILQILDEESKLPKPSYSHFTSEVHKHWPNEFRIGLPRSSKLKSHRSLRDDEGFLIRHFAGAVCYQTKQFIDKNNDALHASLEGIVQDSKSKLIQTLFATSNAQKGKLTFISVGNKFKTQLLELMEKLRKNGTNFIRCIKPNNKMLDNQFDGALCLMQLKCLGMTSVLELMEHGYPSRAPFTDLYNMYKEYLPPELKKLNPKTFCEAMLHSLKLKDRDFKFGVTRVFFRPGKFAEFDKIMKSDPENLKAIIADVKKFLVKSRWTKAQFCALTVIKLKNKIIYRKRALVVVQKTVKGYLTRKRHGPRIKALTKIKSLDGNLKKMEAIAGQLKKEKEATTNEINQLKTEISGTIGRIKKEDKMAASALDGLYKQLVAKVDKQMDSLQKKLLEQKNAEEQARLKKIQEEMEREKKRKEEEERRLREEEENRKKKAEMEARRKKEEEERKRQEEADRRTAELLQAQQAKDELDERRYQEQLEQERQDHELALRLAQESNGQLEESPPMIRNGGADTARQSFKLNRSEAVKNQQAALAKGKYDLTKWKYSELRDTINTSCDIELLEACRHEFHRRLKVYHAWKAKNRKRTIMDENERAPRSVMESAARTPKIQQKAPVLDNNSQRYFRIPFVRPGGDNSKRGWWYAHFDGQYVARQIELHPEKAPILLVAGKDDMQMCELSLEETGLTRKRGAEILESEFNKEWEKHGGAKYVRPADRKQ